MPRRARRRGERTGPAQASQARFAFQLPESGEERASRLLPENGRGELEVLVLELGVGERHVRVALARRLEMLAAPAVARLDRDARRALRRKRGIERGVRTTSTRRMSARVAGSWSRAGSKAA